MSPSLQILLISAASIGFFHTLLGPDHYLPFIMIGKARNWALTKVIWLTILCGIGHVLSSVILGLVGIALEVQLAKLEFIESYRGNLAAWALIAFGLLYALWGVRHWYNKTHTHVHDISDKKTITPWVLFIIFVLGPCEALIPLVMFPSVHEGTFALLMVTGVFGVTTLVTMTTIVILSSYGLRFLSLNKFEKWSHSIAGMVIFLSGLAIQVLGL